MLLVSVWLAFARQGPLQTRALLITASLLLGGLASLWLSFAKSLGLAILLVALVGASLALFTPIVWGMLQELTTANLRGRVFTIFSSAAMLTSMVGMLAFGWAADTLGPAVSLVAMAGVLAATGLFATLLNQHKARFQLEALPQPERRPASR